MIVIINNIHIFKNDNYVYKITKITCCKCLDVFIFKAKYLKSFYTFIKPQNYMAVSYPVKYM